MEEVLDILTESVGRAGYECGKDICFALDVAASEWKSEKGKGYYHLPKSGQDYTTEELIARYKQLLARYPNKIIGDLVRQWKEVDYEGHYEGLSWGDVNTNRAGQETDMMKDFKQTEF